MTITMEVGDIKRFKTDGDFASYCRMVDAKRLSNGKCKGANNQKCGNKYLAWAFVEAANFARRYDEQCRRWYDRKAAKTSKVIATKALGCKLAKAAWHVMAGQCDYDEKRMFPELANKPMKTS
jgi:transposase